MPGHTDNLFPRAWKTAGHCDILWNTTFGTYHTVPFEYLPKLGSATDDFAWLDDVNEELRAIIATTSTLGSDCNEIANLETVIARIKKSGLKLPDPFLRFMKDSSLQRKVPSCTACYLSLSENAIPVPGSENHFLLRFLNDSQSCVLWYLLMGQDGTARVVQSHYFFDREIFDGMEYAVESETEDLLVKYEDSFKEAFICADTFTEFLYRFWIENTVWYSAHKHLKLTPLQEEYLSQITKNIEYRD